jgi:hypothetical protein
MDVSLLGVDVTLTAEEKRDAMRKSKWALAYVLQEWKRNAAPLGRAAYRADGHTDPNLCDLFAEKLEGMARTARVAAELAREERDDH